MILVARMLRTPDGSLDVTCDLRDRGDRPQPTGSETARIPGRSEMLVQHSPDGVTWTTIATLPVPDREALEQDASECHVIDIPAVLPPGFVRLQARPLEHPHPTLAGREQEP